MDNKSSLPAGLPFSGRIRTVHDQIVEVEYTETDTLPDFFDILTSPEDKRIMLEVYAYSDSDSLFCLSLTPRKWLYRDLAITSTGNPLTIPGGMTVLSRVMNLYGEPQDNGGLIEGNENIPIYTKHPAYRE